MDFVPENVLMNVQLAIISQVFAQNAALDLLLMVLIIFVIHVMYQTVLNAQQIILAALVIQLFILTMVFVAVQLAQLFKIATQLVDVLITSPSTSTSITVTQVSV